MHVVDIRETKNYNSIIIFRFIFNGDILFDFNGSLYLTAFGSSIEKSDDKTDLCRVFGQLE